MDLSVETHRARNFLVSRLLAPPGPDPDVSEIVRHLGFVQEDSIDACGRMHDLILRNRRPRHSPSDTLAAAYGDRTELFETHFPNLALLPLEHLRYFASAFRGKRVSRPLASEHVPVAGEILEHVRRHGAVRARDLESGNGATISGWGTTRTVSTDVAERLWSHGRLAIASRKGFERWFDLPERRFGDEARWLDDEHALPPAEESIRMRRALTRRSRPIAPASRALGAPSDQNPTCTFTFAGSTRPWSMREEDFEVMMEAEAPPDRTLLLAPLDPVIYDRDLTEAVFGVRYRWEVYVPKAKRRLGYYVLPVLCGNRLGGWVDVKRDSAAGVLRVEAGRIENRVDRAEVLHQLVDLARMNGLDDCCARNMATVPEGDAFA